MKKGEVNTDRDHPEKTHPAWVKISVQFARNLVTEKISAQNGK